MQQEALVCHIEMDDAVLDRSRELVREVASCHDTVEDRTFLELASTYAQDLPRALRQPLNRFRLAEPASLCVVSGWPVDDDRIGPTPTHWESKPVPSPALEEEIFFFLCGSLLGDPLGWATQQDGYVMHDLLPIRGHEQEQLGSSSETVLTWHTEDAFHPYRADYVSLMCLRNPNNVQTTVAAGAAIELDDDVKHVLFEPRFTIRPDESHLPKNRSYAPKQDEISQELLTRSYERIERMNEHPEPIPVLFGDPERPYLRLDPYFMERPRDDEARHALDTLVAAIDRELTGVALRPGELCFIDNFKAVHGRQPFHASYDGRDRWMKRLNIVRDVRKSRDARQQAASRIIV